MNEVHQTHTLRSGLIKRLKTHFDATIITFFTSFHRRNVMVVDSDAEMLESLLASEHEKGKKVVLILNSPGGSALAAERIVNVCRAYSHNQFEVVVPHMAKSAATMICFGATKIHMSKTAELGPVDPQVPYWPESVAEPTEDNANWISAEEYVRSYDKLMAEATAGKAKRIEPYLQQLTRYDARSIEKLRSAQKLSTEISLRLLGSLMMKNVPMKRIKKRIGVFISQERTRSHGRMINHDEAKKCGLNVEVVDLQSDVWHCVWELYVRSNYAVTERCGRVMESEETGLQTQ
jgi:hypothetical protein